MIQSHRRGGWSDMYAFWRRPSRLRRSGRAHAKIISSFITSTTHLPTYYPPTTHLIPIWYPPDTHLIPTWYPPEAHLKPTWYSPDTHLLPTNSTNYPPTTQLQPTYYPPTIHLLPTYSPPTTHLLPSYYPLLPTYYPEYRRTYEGLGPQDQIERFEHWKDLKIQKNKEQRKWFGHTEREDGQTCMLFGVGLRAFGAQAGQMQYSFLPISKHLGHWTILDPLILSTDHIRKISDNLWPSQNISDHLGPFSTILDLFRPSWTFFYQVGPSYYIIMDHLRLC